MVLIIYDISTDIKPVEALEPENHLCARICICKAVVVLEQGPGPVGEDWLHVEGQPRRGVGNSYAVYRLLTNHVSCRAGAALAQAETKRMKGVLAQGG